MKQIAAIAAAVLIAAAPSGAVAQETDATEGFSLIEEGAKLLLRGLTDEIEPMMQDLATEMEPQLRAFAEDLLPMLENFSDLIGDLNQYHPPEKLPNGDIILRRKTQDDTAGDADGDGEVEL